MKKFGILTRASLGLSVVIAMLAAGSAQATTISTTCTQPVLYQPFLPFNDGNWYSLVPGESYDSFPATGWTLSGGASVVTASLYDPTTGPVLNLPYGSKAVSPQMCLNNTYPYMRMMLHDVNSGSVSFQISYLQTSGVWKSWQSTGSVTTGSSSWVLTGQVNLASGPYTGWNYAKIMMIGGGKTTSTSQVYNVYDDPRMKY
jgi:hypothetical protein